MYLAGALLSSDHHPRWGLHVAATASYRARRRSITCALRSIGRRTRWTDCGVGVGAVRACADAVLAVVGAAEAVAEQGAPRSIDELSHGWRAMACVRCSSMWSGSQTVPPTCSPAELQIEDSAKMTDTKMDLRGARLSPLTLTARNVTRACRRRVVQAARCRSAGVLLNPTSSEPSRATFCWRASRASPGARSAEEHPSARAARGLWCGLSALRSDDFASFLARLAARALLHSLLETRLSSCVHWAHSRALYCVQRPVGGGGHASR